jgi:hypothetical protein
VLLLLTLVAWGALVSAAIDFGRQARSGDADAWKFLALVALGAVGCLFVTLILGAKIADLFRGPVGDAPPARLPGGRRAAR